MNFPSSAFGSIRPVVERGSSEASKSPATRPRGSTSALRLRVGPCPVGSPSVVIGGSGTCLSGDSCLQAQSKAIVVSRANKRLIICRTIIVCIHSYRCVSLPPHHALKYLSRGYCPPSQGLEDKPALGGKGNEKIPPAQRTARNGCTYRLHGDTGSSCLRVICTL